MNKTQMKDLQSVLRSIELNEMVLSNIQQMLEKEKFVIEERRDSYESKGTDYWDDKAAELEDRIDILDNEEDVLEEIVSSMQELIGLMREKVGEMEGNIIHPSCRMQKVAIIDKNKSLLADKDSMFEECARFIVTQTTASTSMLQRRFGIGYNKAGEIMDQMEAAGIVGPACGQKPRAILVDSISLEDIINNG